MFHSSHHTTMLYEMWVGGVGILGIVINALSWIFIGGIIKHFKFEFRSMITTKTMSVIGYSYQQQGFLGSHKEGTDMVIAPSARRGPQRDPRIRTPGPVDAFRDFFGN